MEKNNLFNKPVLIKTYSGIFDCIGIIQAVITGSHNEETKERPAYAVKVLTYVNGNYSKKDQVYYLTEVAKVLTNVDATTVKLLYTGD